ncbi:flavin-containing monooxygenase 5-like [Haliotis cracherodii]|uniref:flavin-containing monooxygenase 5-like n=1 Tax=Haliotis cracherodii TaxID=6455 RepID=UPI0039E80BDC
MKILVIGCGASGLTAIKCCLDEGLDPVCLERTDDEGGLWNYQEKVRDDQGTVMKSTIINTSKEMMAYSDYPMPDEYPNFTHNSQVLEYLRNYKKHFGLDKHIQYNREAVLVKPADNFETTGKWDVKIRDHKTGSEEHVQFDGVLVCTGHHATKNVPEIPGQELYEGKMMHSQDFKHADGWEDKKALVIGIGNSGVDTANDLSRVAKKTFISTRRGTWLIPRNMDNGLPFDIARTTRMYNWIGRTLPASITTGMVEDELNKMYDHKLYCLQPTHRFNAQHPNMSSDLPMNISTGRIVIKGDIRKLTKTGVEFKDGTCENDIDLVVLATGYKFGFPFIDKSVVDVKNNKVDLYQYMFPPDRKIHTLAIIGCIQPLGAVMPISELQCRLATRVFKGLIKLPSRDKMWSNIRAKQAALTQRYVNSPRHTIQVDFVDFMDQIGNLVGCKPNLWRYLLTDPGFAVRCFFGPCTPFQYRLQGPGKWAGAKEACEKTMDRVRKPFQTRPLPDGLVSGTYWTSAALICFYVVLLAFLVKVLLL